VLRFLHAALEPHLTDGEGRSLVGGLARSLDTMSSILSSLLDVNRLETAISVRRRATSRSEKYSIPWLPMFRRFRC
jgi:hypothetical protein